MPRPLHVLISAYACGPNWGSEIGMGWNWVLSLSTYCQLTVITEFGFKEEIEQKMGALSLNYIPNFHYIDVGDRGRALFWKQGSFLFYSHYRKWQKEAYQIARKVVDSHEIAIVHQLNMIGYREPGYLWQIEDAPFIWGPVGGFNQIPTPFLLQLDLRNLLFYGLKNSINTAQKYGLIRVKRAARAARVLIGATKEAQQQLKRISKKQEVLLMGETGCKLYPKRPERSIAQDKKLHILWVGRLQARKALGLALKALAQIHNQIDFIFTIVGKGEDEKKNKRLSASLGIEKNCNFLGEIPNQEVMKLMRESHFLLFTSLVEGTPHVVTEALQNGLPVICHDTCGHGFVVNASCGIKVPVINPAKSVSLFRKAIVKLALDNELQEALSEGAFARAREISWDQKAQDMVKIYNDIL